MGILSYYFAMSLDGFIARENNAVDWLDKFDSNFSSKYDYLNYYSSVSALIFGRKTWEAIRSLSSDYPYAGKPAFLFTTNKNYSIYPQISEISICVTDVIQKITSIKRQYPKRIWLVGGGEFATYCMNTGLVNEIIITVLPITLGRGIRWIKISELEQKWKLIDNLTLSNGCVQLVYNIEIS